MSEEALKDKIKKLFDEYQKDVDWVKEAAEVEQGCKERRPIIVQIMQNFLDGKISLEEFRKAIEKESHQYNYWGFTGTQGQMFFNMLVKYVPDKDELIAVLKECLPAPDSFDSARTKISRFTTFVKEQREKIENKYKAPQVGRSLYFLTYFWEKQKEIFPIYWPSIVEVLGDFGMYTFDPGLGFGENYRRYVEALQKIQNWLKVPQNEVINALYHYYKTTIVKAGPKEEPPVATSAELPAGQTNELFVRITELLKMKKQLIFYGPPGTGKTYWALKFAKSFAPDAHEIVQFHPSYSYEDFVIGLKPISEADKVVFKPVDGVFKKFCDRVRGNGKPAVFIIDEINRGNIPKIFGELLYALEDRSERKVRLPYTEELWSVPENVIIIGTMNTADRSIALLDVALRRRFFFLEFAPDSEFLRHWLAGNGADPDLVDKVPKLMDVINERLTTYLDRNHQIGHTYFMKENMNWSTLRVIFYNELIPLLQEFFYDDYEKIAKVIGEDFFTTISAGDRKVREVHELSDEEFIQAIGKLAGQSTSSKGEI